jgi:pilus assembly protein CpaF
VSVPLHVFDQTVALLFAPITPFLEGDDVSEIMINGHDEIYVERHGRLYLTGSEFASEHVLMSALRNLSQFVGRELNPRQPILEARLPDGSRVEAIIPPASPAGPVVCIRRFRRKQLTLNMLVELGAISRDASGILRAIVTRRNNVIIAGGSGVVQLEAQPPDVRGHGGVTIRELFRATLRMRPDRIVIGEIRGGEALDLIQAMTSGHRGCLSTVHATLPIDTLSRLETMALMSDVDVPLNVLRAQIASAIDIVIQVARRPDGSREVTHVSEVLGYDREEGYRIRHLYEQFAESERGK